MGQDSNEFLKVLFEFMPLHKKEQDFGVQMNFILTTNFVIGTELLNMRDWEFNKYEKLSEKAIAFGKKNYGRQFHKELFMPDLIRLLLSRFVIFTSRTDELEKLHKEDKGFQEAYNILSRRLLNIPRRGSLFHQIMQPDIVAFCRSRDHKECFTLTVDDKICHVGKLSIVRKELEKALKSQRGRLISTIPGGKIGLTSHSVRSRDTLSPEGISRILYRILNNKTLLRTKYPHNFYVLPGTFDILAFEAVSLAKKIKETRDELEKVHPLDVAEVRELGIDARAIEDITRLAYQYGLGYDLPSSDIVVPDQSDDVR